MVKKGNLICKWTLKGFDFNGTFEYIPAHQKAVDIGIETW